MRLILILILSLFLVPFAKAQTDTISIEGEYQFGILFGGVFKTGGGGSSGQGGSGPTLSTKGILQNIAFNDGKTRTVIKAASGLHSMFVITPGSGGSFTGDTLWGTGLNDGHWRGSGAAPAVTNFIPILLDNSGSPLTNIAGVWASATAAGNAIIDSTSWIMVWKTDGTVWRLGNATGGLAGDGTTGNANHMDSFFVQIPTPSGGWFVDDIQGMFFPIAHDTVSGGRAWTWGNQNYIGYSLGQAGDYRTPHTVNCGGKAILNIASNSLVSYCITSDHHLWGWSFYSALLGVGVHWSGTSNTYNSPTDITTLQGIGLTYSQISCIEETSFAIMSDSTMRSWGDNPEGTAGVIGDAGYQINMFATTPPFNYNGGQGENIVPRPLNPFASCATKIKHIPKGGYYQRDGWVCDYGGHWYHMGRNKNGVGLFVVNGDRNFQQEAQYPDWANDTIPVLRDIFSTQETLAEAAYCTANPGASFCHSNYNPPTEANPTISAGSNQNVNTNSANLSGTASAASGHSIVQYKWSSSCGLTFSNPFSQTPTFGNLALGNNVATLTVWDDANKISTSTVTINYALNSCNCLKFILPTIVR